MSVELTPEWAFSREDKRWMEVALAEAAIAGARGDVPVGAVLVSPEGHELARAGNRREQDQDPTAHAELLVIRQGAAKLGSWRLAGCTLYVTLEPCAMCAAACVLARLGQVVFGTPDLKAGFGGSLANLLEDPRLNHRVRWRAGLFAERSRELLAAFFANRREKL